LIFHVPGKVEASLGSVGDFLKKYFTWPLAHSSKLQWALKKSYISSFLMDYFKNQIFRHPYCYKKVVLFSRTYEDM